MKICVYCASSERIDEAYFQAAERLAEEFVRENIKLVYGGGSTGLMGRVAEVVLRNDGWIKGVIPRFMAEIENVRDDLSEIQYTETVQERKACLLEDADAIVALPGGTGTLEELLEAITLKRLGQFFKPIVILNTAGFYDHLEAMLMKCVTENFMKEKHLQMWSFVSEPQEVLPKIRETPDWDKDALSFAIPRYTGTD